MDPKTPQDMYDEDAKPSGPYPQPVNPYEHWSIQWMKFLVKNKAVLQVLIVLLLILDIWISLGASDSAGIKNFLTKQPTRMNLENAYVREGKEISNLQDLSEKYNMDLVDDYLYLSGQGEAIGGLIEKYEALMDKMQKLKAVATTNAGPLPKNLRTKPSASAKLKAQLKKKKASECEDQECLQKIIDEINEEMDNVQYFKGRSRP